MLLKSRNWCFLNVFYANFKGTAIVHHPLCFLCTGAPAHIASNASNAAAK